MTLRKVRRWMRMYGVVFRRTSRISGPPGARTRQRRFSVVYRYRSVASVPIGKRTPMPKPTPSNG